MCAGHENVNLHLGGCDRQPTFDTNLFDALTEQSAHP